MHQLGAAAESAAPSFGQHFCRVQAEQLLKFHVSNPQGGGPMKEKDTFFEEQALLKEVSQSQAVLLEKG